MAVVERMGSKEKEKEDKVKEVLTVAGGKLATEDEETFAELVGILIDNWKIKRPQEIMLVNRMVSTWMRIRKVEETLSRHHLFFEQKDEHGGLKGCTMNQMAYYLQSLDKEFRGYYKTLQGRTLGVPDKVQDFGAWINDGAKKEKEKKK